VDHLAQQINISGGVFFEGFVTDLDGILYAITKSKMTCYVKPDGTQV
jgi:hypothetical protein